MVIAFRETIASLRDLNYGRHIISQTVGAALWYWTRYLIFFAVIGLVIAVAAVTYFTPQVSRLLAKSLPDIRLAVKDGQLVTDAPQPFVFGDDNFVFIVNTAGSAADLDAYPAGILILKDRLIAKTEDGIRTQNLSGFDDMEYDKSWLVKWTADNKSLLLVLGLGLVILLTILVAGFSWVWQVSAMLVWAVLFWVVALVLKRRLSYLNVFKLVLYASVVPLFLSAVSVFSPGSGLSLIGLAALVFYTLSWIWHLPPETK